MDSVDVANTPCAVTHRPHKRRRTSSTLLSAPEADVHGFLGRLGADKQQDDTYFDGSTPVTPPSVGDATSPDNSPLRTDDILSRATNVLVAEAAAVAAIAELYRTDACAREALVSAVEAIVLAQQRGGKLVVCGVGKSAYIAQKMTATCKSFGIAASFMHACEAVHGDLGDVKPHDVLLFHSFSGRTPELLNLLPHLPSATRIMAISGHRQVSDCQLLAHRDHAILLPAVIPEKEETLFGVCAPTVSTTVALAVSDMLALTLGDEVNAGRTAQVFKRHHPGGAIGLTHREVDRLGKDGVELAVLELPSPSISGSDTG